MFLRFLRRKSGGINTQTIFDKLTQAREQRERNRECAQERGMTEAGNIELFVSSISYLSIFI